MAELEPLIPKHGGYRRLKSFQIAQLVYDVTLRFCDRYVDKRSRTHDQMVQAARSGAHNIVEGSQTSGTSKKSELRLTDVARASIEELKADYEAYLRQNGFEQWPPDHPSLLRFKSRRCATLDEVVEWVHAERSAMVNPANAIDKAAEPVPSSVLVANAALSLINLGTYLLDRQLASLADDFEQNGGFSERLYRRRKQARGDRDA